MYVFAIDTCVWMDVAKKHPKLLAKLKTFICNGQMTLTLSPIVRGEWDRNKGRIVEDKRTALLGDAKAARRLFANLAEEETHIAQKIDGFQRDTTRIDSFAGATVVDVDELLSHESVVICEASTQAKSLAIDLALAKKAPFQGKNSMADALIFLSFAEMASRDDENDYVFVSSNTSDFASDKDKGAIHPDLVEVTGGSSVEYYSNIALALKEITEAEVDKEEIEEIDREVEKRHDWGQTAPVLKSLVSAALAGPKMTEFVKMFEEPAAEMAEIAEMVKMFEEQNARATEIMKVFEAPDAEIAEMVRMLEEQNAKTAEMVKMFGEPTAEAVEMVKMFEEQNARATEIVKVFEEPDAEIAEIVKMFEEQNAKTAEMVKMFGEPTTEVVEMVKMFEEQNAKTAKFVKMFEEQNAKATEFVEMFREPAAEMAEIVKVVRMFEEQNARATEFVKSFGDPAEMAEMVRMFEEQVGEAAEAARIFEEARKAISRFG